MSSERDDVSTEAETPRGRDEHGRFVRGGGAPTRSSNDEAELPGSGGDGVEDGNLDETPRRDVLSSDEGVTDEQVAAVTAEHARRKAMRAIEMEEMRQEMEFAKLRAQRIETEAADVKRQRDLEASLRAQERKQEEEELEFAVRKVIVSAASGGRRCRHCGSRRTGGMAHSGPQAPAVSGALYCCAHGRTPTAPIVS